VLPPVVRAVQQYWNTAGVFDLKHSGQSALQLADGGEKIRDLSTGIEAGR
jgi:hypothetical protein